MPCEGEGEGQCTDTSAVHIHDEDKFGGGTPVGASTRGEATSSEGGGGFKNSFGQRHIGLGQSQAETGYQDERERHEDNGCGLVHQIERDGLMLEFNTFLSLNGSHNGPYQHKEGGGFHTAGGGTGRAADEHQHNNHNDRGQSHVVHIQHHKSGCTAGYNLEYGGENLIEKRGLQTQCAVALDEKEEDGTDSDNPKRGDEHDLGLRHQTFPMVFVSLFYIRESEKIADGQETNATKENENHNDDLREVAVGQTEVQQTFVNEHEPSIVESRDGVKHRVEEILAVVDEESGGFPVGEEQGRPRQLDDEGGENNAPQQRHGVRNMVGGHHVANHVLVAKPHIRAGKERGEECSKGEYAHTTQLDEYHNHNLPPHREAARRTHHTESCDTAGTGGREQRINERDAVGGHTGHGQQNRANQNQKQKGGHHQHRRAQIVFAQRTAHLRQFNQDNYKKIELDEKQIVILEVF